MAPSLTAHIYLTINSCGPYLLTNATTYPEYDHFSSPPLLESSPETQKVPETRQQYINIQGLLMCKMESLGPMRLQVAESKSIKWYFSMYIRKSNTLQKPNRLPQEAMGFFTQLLRNVLESDQQGQSRMRKQGKERDQKGVPANPKILCFQIVTFS